GWAESALEIDEEHRQDPDHAGGNVRTVESGQREERGSEQVGLDRESFIDERRELIRLTAKEPQSEQRRHEQPKLGIAEDSLAEITLRLALVLDRRKRQHHRERRHQKNERRCRRYRNVQNRVIDMPRGRIGPRCVRIRPYATAILVDQVG